MKYLKRFVESESYSVFDSNGWKRFLPKKLNVVTNNGSWALELPQEEYGMKHATNITNLMNCIQISYYQNTPSKEGGDVTRDAEPDNLEFDITIVKNNNGEHANPKSLKLDVDITYGDSMTSEFTIEMPNKVDVIHYTGYGSKYDNESFFGFDDDTIEDLVAFFNSWGYQLTKKDLSFIDKYPDSYVHNERIMLNPSFSEKHVLVVNNSMPQENRYLGNVIKYLDFRGTPHKIASTPEEAKKICGESDIIGAILTGSEYRIAGRSEEGEMDASRYALESLSCPILGICYGMQAMAALNGAEVEDSGEFKHGSFKLTGFKDHPLFKGLDMKATQFSFSFHDSPAKEPDGYEVIGKLDGHIAAIANDGEKRYGTLFHPEDIEYTCAILDNFIDMCDGGQAEDAEDLKDHMKIGNVVESYREFIKNK